MPLAILLIGISWDQYDALAGPEKAPEMIKFVEDALASGEKQLRDAGLDYKLVTYGPEESMDRLKAVLGEREWAGVCVGAGIRMNKQYVPLFEALVNTVHETSPKSQLLFNSTPSDTLAAVKRRFPDVR